MKKIILVLGGARSGKSRFAQEYAHRTGEKKVLFVATATAGDEDMHRRIEKHKRERPTEWHTLEVATNVGRQIEERAGDTRLVIIDCITLLINNLFSRYDEKEFDAVDDSMLEKDVVGELEQLRACLQKVEASFLIVSNEVGLGLVPDNRMGRLYRDFLGRANQVLAQEAGEVYLLVAGIPLMIKPVNPL